MAATLAGSISLLSPIESARFKRLALLQGQLVKNIQHMGGLNPKGYRYVLKPQKLTAARFDIA